MSVELKATVGARAVGTICEHTITYRTYGTDKKYRYLFLPTYCTYGTKHQPMVEVYNFNAIRLSYCIEVTNLDDTKQYLSKKIKQCHKKNITEEPS